MATQDLTFAYPARLEPAEEGGFTVTFRDLPEAITEGDDRAHALEMARDCLVVAVAGYLDRRQALPLPSPAQPGEALVPLATVMAAKAALHMAMADHDVGVRELARRLGANGKDVTRLLDPDHASKIAGLEAAIAAAEGGHLQVVWKRAG